MTKPKYLVLDIETTGLDSTKDGILEIGAVAIDESFHNIGAYSAIVKPSVAHYERLFSNPYVCAMHDGNGLTQATEHGLPLARVDANLFDWLSQVFGYLPAEVIIAGHTVSLDHGFIKQQMPLVGSLLSHRMLDFSVPIRLLRGLGYEIPEETMPHRGLPDALIELKEFQCAMRLLAQDRHDAKMYRARHEPD